MPIIPFILLIFPAILEGVGVRIYHNLFYFLYYLVLPIPFYFYILFAHVPLRFPKRAGLFFLLFVLLTNFSFFFASVNKQVSFERLLISVSFFLLFLFFYNIKGTAKKNILWFISFLGFFFVLYSFLIPSLKYLHASFLIPLHEKQAVLAVYGSHNHLGDFLGLVLLILIFVHVKKKYMPIRVAVFIIIFYLMIVAFSRSAYVSFFITFLLFIIQHRRRISWKYLGLGFILLSILIYASFSVGSGSLSKESFLFPLQQYMKNKLLLAPRDILSGRDKFALQALNSIRRHPLFGVGPGNFITASLKYNNGQGNLAVTDSAHNIFLEIAVEQGIPTAICYLIFIILILLQALKRKDLYGYLFIYLLINFQTDYTYQIFLFYTLFIVISATIYNEGEEDCVLPSWSFGTFAILLLCFLTTMLTSTVFFDSGFYLTAINWYPFNKYAYISAIQAAQNDEIARSLIRQVDFIAPNDAGVAVASGAYYLKKNRKKDALAMYEKAYAANHLVTFPIMKQIYFLKKELVSEKEANLYLREIVNNLKYVFIPDTFKVEFKEFCRDANEGICKETGWYN